MNHHVCHLDFSARSMMFRTQLASPWVSWRISDLQPWEVPKHLQYHSQLFAICSFLVLNQPFIFIAYPYLSQSFIVPVVCCNSANFVGGTSRCGKCGMGHGWQISGFLRAAAYCSLPVSWEISWIWIHKIWIMSMRSMRCLSQQRSIFFRGIQVISLW